MKMQEKVYQKVIQLLTKQDTINVAAKLYQTGNNSAKARFNKTLFKVYKHNFNITGYYSRHLGKIHTSVFLSLVKEESNFFYEEITIKQYKSLQQIIENKLTLEFK